LPVLGDTMCITVAFSASHSSHFPALLWVNSVIMVDF
jgi:hypothetical protein